MYTKFIDVKEAVKGTPFYNYISLSNICNANCVFCDVHENKVINTKLDVFKLLDDLNRLGAKYVHFTGGGEPFANKKIFDYFEYATKLGLNIVVITNGIALTKEKIESFKNYNIKAMFFSIDSYKPEVHDSLRQVKNTFSNATMSINYIKELYPDIKIVINHVLQDSNIDDFKNMILLKRTVNYDYLNPIIVKECPEYYFSQSQISNYLDNLELYKKTAKEVGIDFLYDDIVYFYEDKYLDDGSDLRKNKIKCKCMDYITFIDCVSGYVYPCDCSVHRDKEFYALGNLLNDSLDNILKSDKAKDLKNILKNKCTSCKSKCDYANILFNEVI